MEETKNRIAGIDLGTTYSCIAYMDDMERPNVSKNKEGETTKALNMDLKITGLRQRRQMYRQRY